ncbi:MAG: DUF1800 family protein [Fimbriimonadaceae bacterium]|nr:DUF1800 family protein [Fimbriimonadaceae bacterium]QYK58833.1 MAG: DUF1800 family protein [Fimbriimonadaceae bacterium]
MTTERDRVAHLLRRFGLGAGRYEVDRYAGLGAQGTLRRLIDDARHYEDLIDPWDFSRGDNGEIDPNAYILAGWWGARMLATRRPLQEKIALFWHDHFPVDAEKVFETPLMLGYLRTFYTHGLGRFRDLLSAVIKQGAVLAYLDNNTSSRLTPNENLARETLELFTLGRGNFNETDVRDGAKALTGWTLHYLGTGLEIDFEVLRKRATDQRIGVFNPCFVPAMHDPGEKTILGEKGPIGADRFIELCAQHPATRRRVCSKLWRFFAGTEPTDKVIKELGQVWEKTDGSIADVLTKIAALPEFWAPEVLGRMPRSPVDWTVSLFRSLDLGLVFDQFRKESEPGKPVKKELKEGGGGIHYLMGQQGLRLLFPPNVGGWNWGPAWVTTANSIMRIQHADTIFWGGGDDRPLATWVATKIMTDHKPVDSMGLVKVLANILDITVPENQMGPVARRADELGGVGALTGKDSAANVLANVAKMLFAVPEAQLC